MLDVNFTLKAGQGRKIYYDGEAMRVTNVPEANAFLTREYRSGWSLVALPDGRKFLRRAFQGQYPVTAVKSSTVPACSLRVSTPVPPLMMSLPVVP